MGKKRPLTHEEQQEKKKHRTDDFQADLSTDEVEVDNGQRNNEGVVVTSSFRSKIGCQSIQQIKHRIEQDDELIMGRKFFLYPAFKMALLRLLTKIEEALTNDSDPVRLILIHGLPGVGKTSLAKCLSYFLALSTGGEDAVHYARLSHSAKVDSDVLSTAINDACNKHKYLIVDQVNTHSLVLSEIVSGADDNFTAGRSRTPLIMFTSGHYTPGQEWLNLQKSGFLCYKLITMQIDAALVTKLRQLMAIPQGDVSSDDLLKVTTCYLRMTKCLNYLRFTDPSAKEDTLRNAIYPDADMELIRWETAIHFVWLTWKEFLSKGLPPLDQFTEDDCKLNPYLVDYLGYLISCVKDTRDRGVNALLNVMDITGQSLYESNGYIEFESDSYCYKFLHKRRLHGFLKSVVIADRQLSYEDKYQKLLSAFNQLTTEGDSQYQYLRGELFELIISAICNMERDEKEHPVGMALMPGCYLDFVRVCHCEAVATELELCALPLKHQVCEETSMSFWCVLNVPGRSPFEGFDFAYMETKPVEKKPTVTKMQLFRMTVDPEGNTHEKRLIMTDVMEKIKNELVNQKLIERCNADEVVSPYLVNPSSENGNMVLPYRNSTRSITAEIIGFPQKLLKGK